MYINMKEPWVFPVKSSATGLGQEFPEVKNYRNDEHDSFVKGLHPVLLIGRCLGIISRRDILRKEATQKKITLPFLFTVFIAFFLIYTILFIRVDIKRFKTIQTTIEKLGEITLPFYSSTVFFIYLYLLFNSARLRNITQNFIGANQQFSSTPFPSTFTRFCWLISVIYLSLGIAENVMYDVKNVKNGLLQNGTKILEIYYQQTFYHWADLVPYHPGLTLALIALVKCGTWGWVYGDVVAIILSRAISEKFRAINQELNKMISDSIKSSSQERILTLGWEEIRDEFLTLVELTEEIQRFIAPLIMACYAYNMYSIIVNLFFWISPSSTYSLEQSFYVDFAFFQFLFRVMSVTYFAAEVNHVSQSLLGTIQRCPNSLHTLSLDRIEKTVARNPAGICLFGTFMITRNFFVSIISFIFTTEIVLLQTTGASSAAYRAA